MKSWPDQIRRYRRLNAYTQAVLAEILGVEQATVSRWERGTHMPELGMQRRLRDLMQSTRVRTDQAILYRTRNAFSAIKIANRRARNYVASFPAARLHGLSQDVLSNCDYRPFFTEPLETYWFKASEGGFFAGEIAGVRIVTSWRPAGGASSRYCMSTWSPVFMSDGEVMLLSEFSDITHEKFASIAERDRFIITSMDELIS